MGMAILGLGLVIFVHELGHFLVAKACGVKCEKFYLGFDAFDIPLGPFTIPAKLVHFQWGETEYGIGILPLGGYVKMLGQDDNPRAQEEENERVKLPVHTSDVKLVGSDDKGTAKADEPAREQELKKGLAAEGLKSGTTVEEPETGATPEYNLDPRSYQAKPVWQRMCIISAGVVFNVIFAVIFATIAYAIGVPYMPAVVGETQPGTSAWTANLRPNDRFERIGKNAERDPHMRFENDLLQEVMLATSRGEALDLEFVRDGKTIPISLKARRLHHESRDVLGIAPPTSLTLGEPPTVPGMPASKAEPALKKGDRAVAVTIGSERHELKSMADLRRMQAQHFGEPLTLIVSRKTAGVEGAAEATAQEIATEIQPGPAKEIGLTMEIGPIMAVQEDSPAAAAGLRKNDKLLTVAGQAIPDPLLLDQWLRPHWGQEVEVGYERLDSAGKPQTATAKVQVRAPRTYYWPHSPLSPVGSDCLGVAYWVTNIVATATGPVAEGPHAIRPGDEIVEAQLIPGDEKEREYLEGRTSLKTVNIGPDDPNWPAVMSMVQFCQSDTKVKLRFKRADLRYVTIAPRTSEKYFNPLRGLLFEYETETHTAESLTEAAELGFRETGESLYRVVGFFKAIANSPSMAKNTGSVLTIFAVATSEASVGWTRLLVFLTLLSANLAVINILPIPVLDGGHLVFLAAEGIRGKPVDEPLQIWLSYAGLLFLLCVMVLAFGNDIMRFGSILFQ